jgi:hypothetical protein
MKAMVCLPGFPCIALRLSFIANKIKPSFYHSLDITNGEFKNCSVFLIVLPFQESWRTLYVIH